MAFGTSGRGSCLYALCQKTTWKSHQLAALQAEMACRVVVLTSSRKKIVNVPERSNSGKVRDFERAVKTADTIPSTPVRVMKCCMFGVNLNGTDSVEVMIGLVDEVAVYLVSRVLSQTDTRA